MGTMRDARRRTPPWSRPEGGYLHPADNPLGAAPGNAPSWLRLLWRRCWGVLCPVGWQYPHCVLRTFGPMDNQQGNRRPKSC